MLKHNDVVVAPVAERRLGCIENEIRNEEASRKSNPVPSMLSIDPPSTGQSAVLGKAAVEHPLTPVIRITDEDENVLLLMGGTGASRRSLPLNWTTGKMYREASSSNET